MKFHAWYAPLISSFENPFRISAAFCLIESPTGTFRIPWPTKCSYILHIGYQEELVFELLKTSFFRFKHRGYDSGRRVFVCKLYAASSNMAGSHLDRRDPSVELKELSNTLSVRIL